MKTGVKINKTGSPLREDDSEEIFPNKREDDRKTPLSFSPQVGIQKGKVYINETQYFDGVPSNVWEFYIGGYQVAHKWLKDRKDAELTFEDILHYQKIIVSLNETIRIMTEIDLVMGKKMKGESHGR